MTAYPAMFTKSENGNFVVTFRDVSDVVAEGETFDDAFANACETLSTALRVHLKSRGTLPLPTLPQPGEVLIDSYIEADHFE